VLIEPQQCGRRVESTTLLWKDVLRALQMTPLSVFYCDHYRFPLPAGHKFPITKYRLLRAALEQESRFHLQPAGLAPVELISRVHNPDYVQQFLNGSLAPAAMRRIGFPWSPELVNRTLASIGGTLLAAAAAVRQGFGGTLAGGTHHAYRDEGSGFCVFNDMAIAAEWVRAERGFKKIAIVDLDVHQGDGTAAVFQNDPTIFTFSMHAAHNFPFRKQTSVLDIALADGVSDGEYLSALEAALEKVWEFRPEMVFYQAGVDALASDRLGRLALTDDGLRQRDLLVLGQANQLGIPLVVTLGGGYSEPIELTVEAHAQTFRAAADSFAGSPDLSYRRPFTSAASLADKDS
jgi:acetoin utilization deacetylase AcuC-like enzyme